MTELQGVTATLNFALIAPSMSSYLGLGSPSQGPATVFTTARILPPWVHPPRDTANRDPGCQGWYSRFQPPQVVGAQSPIWFRLITCKALALFMENPFRKSWEIGNKFAVGWRGEVRPLRSVCMLAGSLCTLARFIVYSYKLYNMIY